MRVSYQDVFSSNIKAVAYEDGKIYVEFVSGRRFAYTAPRKLFDDMMNAKSKGSFFAKNIKSICPVAWDGYRCCHMGCSVDATNESTTTSQKFFLCDEHAIWAKYANSGIKPITKPVKP